MNMINTTFGNDYFEVFLPISAELTGFTIHELQAAGQAENYYAYLTEHSDAAAFSEFLSVSKNILDTSSNKNQLKNAMVSRIVMNPVLSDIASKIIRLWYLGTWDGIDISELSAQEVWA
ncbi:hypothetical protein [Chryseobacterium sp.]|jgi:hypothetical protein|uniref:hypothetical protein n=1 Tax=Chryseobacterium sp. TaxID=1871047 RepID=UPI002852B267|nr:hypothetical protein [Chryseobacterium sp.]